MSHEGLDLEPHALKHFSVGHVMVPKDFWGNEIASGVNLLEFPMIE
jgi:hypothetical protein